MNASLGKGKAAAPPSKSVACCVCSTDNDFVLRNYVGTCEVFVGGVVLE